MKTLWLVAMGLALSTAASAENPYCMPKADGTHRFPKTGSSCPTGYFATGPCCEALHKDTPYAAPKVNGAPCPSGTFTSGNSCVRIR